LAAGSVWMRQLYAPYGAVRYASNPYGPAPTDYGYTDQRATDLGLMDYRERWYIPALGRFASADTIAPDPINTLQRNVTTTCFNVVVLEQVEMVTRHQARSPHAGKQPAAR